MMYIEIGGIQREIEFRDFSRMVRDGLVPPEAWVCGDVLTAGKRTQAIELRIYAQLRGLPLPPPVEELELHQPPDLSEGLGRIRREPLPDTARALPITSNASDADLQRDPDPTSTAVSQDFQGESFRAEWWWWLGIAAGVVMFVYVLIAIIVAGFLGW